jgi:hypothetical protein
VHEKKNICSFFARPKNEPKKGTGKDNHACFSPIAQSHFPLQKTGHGSHLFRFATAPLVLKPVVLMAISIINIPVVEKSGLKRH